MHHHGGGHANRSKLLAAAVSKSTPIHLFTSAPGRFANWSRGEVHPLPPDVSPSRNPALDLLDDQVIHYGPVGLPHLQRRMADIAEWIADSNPRLFVVDLSVEVALFTRLCGVATALVRLHGKRDDRAHASAFRLADHLIAPFPEQLEDEHTPAWVRQKTHYLGRFSRYDRRREDRRACREQLGFTADQRILTVVNGEGGGARVQSRWEAAARANPDIDFLLVGRLDEMTTDLPNLHPVGFVTDTFPYLKAADVVVGSGGTNTMMEVGAARVPFLSCPEPRPFAEQYCKVRALERFGLTRRLPPHVPAEDWKKLLLEAQHMDVSGWDRLPGFSPPAFL